MDREGDRGAGAGDECPLDCEPFWHAGEGDVWGGGEKMSGSVEKAILAGGCFWGMQDLFRKRAGVVSTRVGYAGGEVPNATYRNHGTHAEAIEIVFDPERTSYRELLEFFLQIHDPTTLNRQGNDIGASYRSAIFYLDEEQRRVAEETIADCRSVGSLAGQGRDRGDACGPVLGGRARASGLPRAIPERLQLPLRPPELGAATSERERPRARYWRPSDLGVRAAAAACGRGRSRPLEARPRPRAGTASRSR